MEELDADEILKRAKKLPNDDARRELRDRLRHEADERHDIDPDVRKEYRRIADEIDAIITTQAEPVTQPTLEDLNPNDVARDFDFEHTEDWIKPIFENKKITEAQRRGIFNDIYRWLCDFPLLKFDLHAKETIAKIHRWGYSAAEKLLLAEHLEKRLLNYIIPIPRGVVADNIKEENKPIGNRGNVDDAWGNGMDHGGARTHIPRRRTLNDKKKIGGKDYDLDGTKLSQKRRKAAWEGVRQIKGERKRLTPSKVRELTAEERDARQEKLERLRERGLLPPEEQPPIKIPDPPKDTHAKRTAKDWNEMARGDGELSEKRVNDPRPLLTEESIMRRAASAAKSDTVPAITTHEIEKQARAAEEAAEEAEFNEPLVQWKLTGFNKDGTPQRREVKPGETEGAYKGNKLIGVEDEDDD
jgi:hypothetical protein